MVEATWLISQVLLFAIDLHRSVITSNIIMTSLVECTHWKIPLEVGEEAGAELLLVLLVLLVCVCMCGWVW